MLPAEGTRITVHESLRLDQSAEAGRRHIAQGQGMTADHVVVAVELGLEGTLERIDSAYELGERSGAWITYRTNMAQEFAIGGSIPGGTGPRHSLIFNQVRKPPDIIARLT